MLHVPLEQLLVLVVILLFAGGLMGFNIAVDWNKVDDYRQPCPICNNAMQLVRVYKKDGTPTKSMQWSCKINHEKE